MKASEFERTEFEETPIWRIPKDWEVVRLGEEVDINNESCDPKRDFPEKRFLYIDIDSIQNETGVIKRAKTIIGKEAPSRARRLIRYNDVIMSTVRPYLKAFAIVPREYNDQICSTGFAVFTCKERILPSYLLYILFSNSIITQCNRMMVGGQYPALNDSQVRKIQLPLPPLPEQQKIAEILSTVDEAIKKTVQAIDKTKRLKKGLMQELFKKGIGHKEFKDTEIGRIPKEWEVMSLGDISTNFIGGGTPSTSNPEYWDGGIPWMTSANLTNRIVYQGMKYITDKGVRNSATNIVPKGSLLMATRVGIGKIGIAGIDIAISQDLTGIVLNQQKVNAEYLYWTIFRKSSYLSLLSQGSTVKGLTRDSLGRVKLPLPPLPEQQKIAEILGAVDKRLEILRRRKEKLERVKKGLIDDLLTGKRRVKI